MISRIIRFRVNQVVRPQRQILRPRPASRRQVIAFLLVGIGCFALFKADGLFGFEKAAEKASADVINLVMGLLGLYDDGARQNSLVVLVDEASLRLAGQDYPPSHGYHAKILSEIIDRHPRAVMLDMFFEADRDGKEDLLKVFGEAERQGIPIYLAVNRPPVQDGIVPAEARSRWRAGVLARYADFVRLVDVQGTLTVAGAASYCTVGAFDDSALCGENAFSGNVAAADLPLSAAFRIYHDLCLEAGRQRWQGCIATSGPPQRKWPTAFELTWGHPWAIDTAQLSRATCEEPDGLGLTGGAAAFWSDGLDGLRSGVAWTPSLQALRFAPAGGLKLTRTKAVSHTSVRGRRCQPDLDAAIKDHVVFYGFGLRNADVVQTPTNRAVSGVFVHAMAFDNLLTYGDRVPAASLRIGGWSVGGDAVNDAVFAAVFVLSWSAWRTRRDDRRWTSRWLRRLAAEPVLTLLLVATGLLLTRFGSLAPINWLGLLACAGLGPHLLVRWIEGDGGALARFGQWLHRLGGRLRDLAGSLNRHAAPGIPMVDSKLPRRP